MHVGINFGKNILSMVVMSLPHDATSNRERTQIITMIDGVAKNKGLPKIFVDTYAFQAQDFYKKHGFYCIGIVPEYMLGHDRIFMRKDVS